MEITLTLTMPEISEGLAKRIHTAISDCMGHNNYRLIKQFARLACIVESYYDDTREANLTRCMQYTKAELAINQIEYLLHKNGW